MLNMAIKKIDVIFFLIMLVHQHVLCIVFFSKSKKRIDIPDFIGVLSCKIVTQNNVTETIVVG